MEAKYFSDFSPEKSQGTGEDITTVIQAPLPLDHLYINFMFAITNVLFYFFKIQRNELLFDEKWFRFFLHSKIKKLKRKF